MTSLLQKIKLLETTVQNIETTTDATLITEQFSNLQTQISSNTNLITNIEPSQFIENGLSISSNYSLQFNKKLSKSTIPGANDITNDSEGNIYVFSDDNLIKFDKNSGEVIWIREDIKADTPQNILVDKDDNIFCIGTGSFGSNNNSLQDETAEGEVFYGGGKDVIIRKFDKLGNVIDRTSGGSLFFGSDKEENFVKADIFDTNLYIVGETNSTDFGAYLIGEGLNDAIFIVKKGISDRFNTDIQWVRRIGSNSTSFEGRFSLIKCDLDGNIFVTGRVDDASIGTMITGEIANSTGCIVAKISPEGNLIWIGRLNGYTIGIDVDLGNNLVISYEHSSNINKIIKINQAGTLLWEKDIEATYGRYYTYLGTSLRINKNNNEIFYAGEGNFIRLDTFGNLIENISIGNPETSLSFFYFVYISLFENEVFLATSTSIQSFGENLIQSDTTTGVRTNILKYSLSENIEKYTTDKIITISQYPQTLDEIANKKYVDREIYNKISTQSLLDKTERTGIYSYVNNLQSIVKMEVYPWSFWLNISGNNETWVSSYNWIVKSIPADTTSDVFKIRYTPISINNYIEVDFKFDWSWNVNTIYKTSMWYRTYGSTDILTRYNKICSEFGENQTGHLKGILLIDSLDEKEIIITIQNYSGVQIVQGGVNILDYSVVAKIIEYKPEIVSSEYTNIQISSIENLQTILDDKQSISLNYPISSITGLQTNLDSLTTNININTNNISSNLNILTSLSSSLLSIQAQQDINTNDIVSLNADSISTKIFYAVRNTFIVIPTVTSWESEFNDVKTTNNTLYTFTNSNTITVLKSGTYKVEYNNAFKNIGYLDRVYIRTIVSINGVSDTTYGGQNSTYIRHRDYGSFSSISGSFIFTLNVNDYIQLRNSITKGTAGTTNLFQSDFSGFELLRGSNILITYLD